MRDPLPIQTPNETERTYGIDSVTILTPFGRVARWISRIVVSA
jgi:hypothetical protein